MDGTNTKTVVLNPNYYTNEHFQIISDPSSRNIGVCTLDDRTGN